MSNMSQDEASLSYQMEFRKMFAKKEYIPELYTAALFGTIKGSRFRSICWKIFLKVLPEDRDDWIKSTRENRHVYETLLEKHQVDPRAEVVSDVSINNPLSSSDLSPWNKYFRDNQIRAEIQQDVVRTFPEIEFFRSSEIQKMMTNILFVYSRCHPKVQYKQGMQELLAPILYVLYNDMQYYANFSEDLSFNMGIRILLNRNYLEHDAYCMFCELMSQIDAWYVMDCNYYEQVEEIALVNDKRRTPFPNGSLPSTMNLIWHIHCRAYDPELYNHLVKMEIAPQIYGIRWLRLLFGREFEIDDLLILWDVIFADNVEFNLYKYIFAAMLISIKQLLLRGDYASCLNHLMRFPHVENVQFVINLALHLREPVKYKRPESRNKSPNLLEVQETEQTERKDFYSSKGLGRAESLLKKNFVGDLPKSLTFSGVRKLWTNPGDTASGPPMCPCPRSSPSDRYSKSVTADQIESDTYWKTYVVKSDSSSTVVHRRLCNVMESKSRLYRASNVTQTHGKDSDKKLSGKSQEIVPLFPPIPDATPKTPKQMLLEIAKKMQTLRSENRGLKRNTEYCGQEMVNLLPELHGILRSQLIKQATEMLRSMHAFKKVRRISEELDSFRKNSVEESLSSAASQFTLESDSDSEYCKEESSTSGVKKSSKEGRKYSGSGSPVSFPDIYKTEE